MFAAGAALSSVIAFLGGCGGDSSTKGSNTVTATSAAAPSDLDKIKEALLKAGVKNPPLAVFDADDTHWSVAIAPDGTGPNGEPPPGRPIPERVIVGKKEFTVQRFRDPNAPLPGKSGDDGRIAQ
jgi:hypothetical protein